MAGNLREEQIGDKKPRYSPNIQSVRQMSKEALSSRYWRRPWPSVSEFAVELGVSRDFLRAVMVAKGIRVRTKGEQQKIDIARGIREPLKPAAKGNPEGVSYFPKKRSPLHRQHIAEANRRGAFVPCAWCGDLLWRKPCRLKERRIAACSISHSSKYWRLTEHHPGDARPVILQRLRDMLQEQRFRALPRTLETLEKAGEPIGARFEEYWEIMQEWST